ncbi:type VII secretion protein EccB [Kribbella sp. NPDC002412]
MASRKDQLQSHQFSVQRMVSALVTRESDPEQPPFRRPTSSAFWSVAIAVLALAVVGVYGLLVPGGSKAWSKGDAVIVEKETGTRFVYVDGRLHPVANYTSALLALGKYGETRRVSRRSLRGVPRGPRIGIPDAPDALPAKDRLLTGGWTQCSQPTLDPTGARTSESVLMVGQRPAGGQTVSDEALLVEVLETGDQYLISKGYRHQIDRSDAAATVGLALRSEPWVKVGAAFVAALPDGERIMPIKPAGIGRPSTAIPERPRTLIGQLFVVKPSSGGVQYYLAAKERLIPISELQYDIQTAYKPMAAAYGGKAPRAIELGLVSVGQAAPSSGPETGKAPRSRPTFVAPRDGLGTVCAAFTPGSAVPSISIDPQLPPRDEATVTPRRGRMGTALADRVLVPPGTAAVIEAMPTDRAPAGTISVVTDMGRIYPLADPGVLAMLGYADVTPVRIPAMLASRLPQGSGLNPAAATRASTQ